MAYLSRRVVRGVGSESASYSRREYVPDILTGLVLHLTMDPSRITWGTNTVTDSSGLGNHGTAVSMSAANEVSGVVGGGLTFDGSLDYINTELSTAFTNFSAACWFYDSGSSGSNARMVDKAYSTGFYLGRGTSANQYGGGIMQTGSPFGTFVTFGTGAWYHLCMTRSGTTQSIYKNGVLATTATVSGSACDTAKVGIADAYGGTATNWNGYLDDVRVYNRVLTKRQVSYLASLR